MVRKGIVAWKGTPYTSLRGALGLCFGDSSDFSDSSFLNSYLPALATSRIPIGGYPNYQLLRALMPASIILRSWSVRGNIIGKYLSILVKASAYRSTLFIASNGFDLPPSTCKVDQPELSCSCSAVFPYSGAHHYTMK